MYVLQQPISFEETTSWSILLPFANDYNRSGKFNCPSPKHIPSAKPLYGNSDIWNSLRSKSFVRVRPDLIRILFEETFSCEKPPDTNGQNVSVGPKWYFWKQNGCIIAKSLRDAFWWFCQIWQILSKSRRLSSERDGKWSSSGQKSLWPVLQGVFWGAKITGARATATCGPPEKNRGRSECRCSPSASDFWRVQKRAIRGLQWCF